MEYDNLRITRISRNTNICSQDYYRNIITQLLLLGYVLHRPKASKCLYSSLIASVYDITIVIVFGGPSVTSC